MQPAALGGNQLVLILFEIKRGLARIIANYWAAFRICCKINSYLRTFHVGYSPVHT
jgi:hypothetical protein